MKLNLTTVLVLFLTALLGWFLGFIKIPYLQVKYTFYLGFVAGLVLLTLFLIILNSFKNSNQNLSIQNILSGNHNKNKQAFVRNIWVLFILTGLILLAGYIGYAWNKSKMRKLDQLETELAELRMQASLDDQKNKISLLLELIHTMDSMRVQTKDTFVLQQMTRRLVSLSSTFKVQKQWDSESKSYRELSSMRGMLLLAFLNSGLDSATFQNIKDQLSFSYADLRNADLRGQNLQGIDLSYANLEQANLEGAQLDYALFRGANLIATNLNRTTLVETNFIGAKLNWAKVNEAKMNYARLDSADFSNATICKSNLKYATYINTMMRYALLQDSDMSNGFFISTDFSHANLSKSNLKDPDFRKANLIGTILSNVIIQDDWFQLLSKESNEGVQEIITNYHVIRDSTAVKDSIIVRLEAKFH
ncbi:MAG: pentapeptide repeat-containing protein [Saprospiraceae bacterium]|nr:pentapeptide repeat-containing protein [Saprospiraceae bacterium]